MSDPHHTHVVEVGRDYEYGAYVCYGVIKVFVSTGLRWLLNPARWDRDHPKRRHLDQAIRKAIETHDRRALKEQAHEDVVAAAVRDWQPG